MVAVFLYVIAGVLAGAYAGGLILLQTAGRAAILLQSLAVVGAALLIVAAVVALFHARAAGRIALIGALAGWAFFLPALRTEALNHSLRAERAYGVPLVISAISVLLLATVHALVQASGASSPAWLFGEVRRGVRALIAGIAGISILAGAAGFVWVQRTASQTVIYVLPAGYVGWIRVDFGVPTAAPLARADGAYVVRVPRGGVVDTSVRLDYGSVRPIYQYGSEPGEPAPIAAGFVLKAAGDSGGPDREYLFVGSQQQHERYGLQEAEPDGLPRPGPVPLTPPR